MPLVAVVSSAETAYDSRDQRYKTIGDIPLLNEDIANEERKRVRLPS
jgi:hypothetical protein